MNKLPYPFLKNHYYNGKLLQAEDFIREQDYFNSKLAFSNAWIFGHGIIEGLRVQKIDGESILLEPGCCIDGAGRMIVVDRSSIHRLATLDGVSQSQNILLLKLYYEQTPVGQVFCPFEETESKMRHHTEIETYRLGLEIAAQQHDLLEEVFLSRTILFQDEELRITQLIPRTLCGGGVTRIMIRVENLTASELEATISYRLETPGFHCKDTGDTLSLEGQSSRFHSGVTDFFYSLVRGNAMFAQSTIFVCKADDFTVVKQGVSFSSREDFREEFMVETGDMRASILQKLRRLSTEELWNDMDAGVTIAALRFVRLEKKQLLDEVLLPQLEQYACHPALLYKAERYLSYYQELLPVSLDIPVKALQPMNEEISKEVAEEVKREQQHFFKTGVVQLETGLNYKPKTVLYSDELIHGLGPGTVYIDFGLEDVFIDQQHNRNKTEVILGDNTMFEQVNAEGGAFLEKAVKIFPDKGTFILAIRSAKRISQPTLKLRWYAFQTPEDAVYTQPKRGGKLSGMTPDMVTIEPKASVSFVPVFKDGESEPCDFFMGTGEKGFVSNNGIYTAPEEEGLFVVTASLHSHPEERVSAFVIVRKKTEDKV